MLYGDLLFQDGDELEDVEDDDDLGADDDDDDDGDSDEGLSEAYGNVGRP